MQAFGMLLLAAAAAGDGFGYTHAGVGLKKWLRPHAVVSSDPTGEPPYTAASMGAGGPGAGGRRFISTKSQVYFLDPDGMQVGWQTAAPGGERVYPPAQLTVPARYNFNQGYIYRLKISKIPGRKSDISLYPTIEVAPTTPGTDAYLAHNAIPIQFTNEDFDQVIDGGNFVTKVIYLPDPKYQELAVSGVETLVSTRLEPGIDPILEADKRGTILLILRLGAIDLEMPNAGGSPIGGTGGLPIGGHIISDVPPGTLPPGVAPTTGNVNLDQTTPPPAPAAGTATPPPAGGTVSPPVPGAGTVTPSAPEPAPPAPKAVAPQSAASSSTTIPLTSLAPSPEAPPVQAPTPEAPPVQAPTPAGN
jgi:hypothetical protein